MLAVFANTLVGAGAALAAFARPANAAVADAMADKSTQGASPIDFGAKGNGITDDTVALQKLAALPTVSRIDGQGRTYMVSQPITFARQIDLKIKVKASKTFPQGGDMVVIEGDQSVVDIDVDANARSVVGVKVSGNAVRGWVRGANIHGSDIAVGGGMQSVLFVTGDHCRFDVHGENLVAASATNPSVPRVLSTGRVAGCVFGSITGNNTTALWVNQAGEVTVNFLYAYQCGNNGIYDIAAGGNIKIGTAIFEGDLNLNLQTVVSESDVSIGSLIVRDVWGYAAVDKGGNLTIGQYSIQNVATQKVHQVVVSREKATTCKVEIGAVTGSYALTAASNGGGVFQFYEGTIEQLKIGRINLDLYFRPGATTELFRQTSGKGSCEISELALCLVDSTGRLTPSTVISWIFPDYAKPSYLNHCSLVSAGGTLSVRNVAQANMTTPVDMELLANDGDVTSTVTSTTPRRFFGTGIPTVGHYRKGDIISNKSPVQGGAIEWLCVEAGSPGGWVRKAGIVKRGTTANRPAGLTHIDAGAMYFDDTLGRNGRPIFWTGAAWVDADGNTI